jgi:hypothetical protein
MRKAQIENGVVVNVIEVDPADIPDWCADWPECESAGPGWLFADGEFSPPLVEAAPLTVDDYRAAIDAHVEATARGRSYNSAAHLASYAASTVALWAAEAQAFIAWRDQVWVTAIGLMQSLQEPPTIEETLGLLPQIEWPE